MCTERYVNPFTDYGFKLLFGNKKAKKYLISFLNSLLALQDPIQDIKYENPEKFGLHPSDRRAVYDLYCTTDSGKHIIVEMQNANQRHFAERSVYYSTFPIVEAAEKGDWNFELPAVYLVAFLNFRMPEYVHTLDFKHVVKLMDVDSKQVFYDNLTYIFLEMPKFRKEINELEDFTDKWLYVINNMNSLDEYPKEIKDEIFRGFFEMAEISAFKKEERKAYEQSLKYLRDYNNTMIYAREEGIEKGKELGRAEGKAEGKAEAIIELARKMRSMGVSTDDIVTFTGLSSDEINQIIE